MTGGGRREEVAGFFDGFAGDYDRAYGGAGVGGRILRLRLEVTAELLGEGPGKALDAGMGSGVLCERLESQGWTATGVDISPAMVDLARARLPEATERLGEGSVLDLPFADATFDAVSCTGVLEYVEDGLGRAVREVSRVARTGSAVVVSLPNYRSLHGLWRFRVFYPSVRLVKRLSRLKPPPSRAIVTLPQLQDALGAAGLQVVGIEVIGMRFLPAWVGARLERSPHRLSRVFGTQFVVLAEKGRT